MGGTKISQRIHDLNARPDPQIFNQQRSRGVAQIVVGQDGDKMRLRNLYQEGCAKLRLPRLFQAKHLEAVMINSSGGMTGGDNLEWSFVAERDAHLTVTTQACERVYKTTHGAAQTCCSLKVEDGASLHWLPQETILFDQSSFAREINVDLAEGSELLMVEPLVFGRAAMGEAVEQADIHDRWRIRAKGNLVHAEDFRLSGNLASALSSPAITNGHLAIATVLLIAPRAEGLLPSVRKILKTNGAASFWNNKMLARVFARNSYELRQVLIPLMELINCSEMRTGALPKVWSS